MLPLSAAIIVIARLTSTRGWAHWPLVLTGVSMLLTGVLMLLITESS